MSACDTRPLDLSTEDARVRVGTVLAHLEVVAQILEELPPPEAAFPQGNQTLFQYLRAAQAARTGLVGHRAGDSVDRPGEGSALGDGWKIFTWGEDETAKHYESAVRDWSERQ